MTEKIGIGIQEFGEIRDGKCFYIDKTYFIREWWESKDKATLIARPRRFGKTLNMSMLKQFFSEIMKVEKIYLRDFQYGRKKSTGSCREHIL